jgi:pseudouridine synthase
VPLNRALSKLGVLSRVDAVAAITSGRVRVNGRLERRPLAPVSLDTDRIALDDLRVRRAPWRAVAFHKPAGVVTTARDPEGRTTVFDVLGDAGAGLIAVGRLDRATSGLLILTSDTQLANWITDPVNAVPRTYIVTVKGRISHEAIDSMTQGIVADGERVRAVAVTLRKVSGRESHLTLVLDEGRNREVRRLCEAVGHPVTRLKRVQIGGLALGTLAPRESRPLSRADIHAAFPQFPRRRRRRRRRSA